MEIKRLRYTIKDERGEITDIMIKEPVEYITLITMNKGTTRGNHYHKETIQWVYIIEGRLKLLTEMPDSPLEATILEKGDLALTAPLEKHAMIALEDSEFMVFTRGIRGGNDYEKDTYRLAEPLKE